MALDDEAARRDAASRGAGSPFGSDLWPRVALGVVMALAAFAAAWAGGFVFVAFWWLASLVVLWEWERLVSSERLAKRVAVGAVAAAAAALFALHEEVIWATAAATLGAVAVGWVAKPPARGWAGAGSLYASALVASLGLLRASPSYGLPAILWLYAVVWGVDIAAYFAGRSIGGPKLWPRVSPAKTWTGAVVGALAGAALGLLLAPWTNRIDRLFWLGLAAAAVAELGDLFESALKRRFKVKDASGLVPGHGGLMDRLDSFLAASVFAAVVATINTRGSFIASGLFQW